MEAQVYTNDGYRPLQVCDYNGVNSGAYRTFSALIERVMETKGMNNISIIPNIGGFPNGFINITRESALKYDNIGFGCELTKEHHDRIIDSMVRTLTNKQYGGKNDNARIVLEIPHVVSVDGKNYKYVEHVWNNEGTCTKDIHLPPEILKRKKEKIRGCNVDLTNTDSFSKEVEKFGKVAEAVIIDAKKYGYEVVLKEMKDGNRVIGTQFCIPSLPTYEHLDDLYKELGKYDLLELSDTIKPYSDVKQRGNLTVDKSTKKLFGTYIIQKPKEFRSDLFGYVGDSLFFFDGLEPIALDEKYTRPITQSFSNAVKTMGTTIYNKSGLPRFLEGLNQAETNRKIEQRKREDAVYEKMKAAGFVKPENKKSSGFERCLIILDEDAVMKEEPEASEDQ